MHRVADSGGGASMESQSGQRELPGFEQRRRVRTAWRCRLFGHCWRVRPATLAETRELIRDLLGDDAAGNVSLESTALPVTTPAIVPANVPNLEPSPSTFVSKVPALVPASWKARCALVESPMIVMRMSLDAIIAYPPIVIE